MPNYTDGVAIMDDHRAYRDRVVGGLGTGSADGELDDLLQAMAEAERQFLIPETPLTQTWAWVPPSVGVVPPFIVGIPGTRGGTVSSPFSEPSYGGRPGALEEDTHYLDRFVAGGVEGVNDPQAMKAASALYLPLRRVYAANGTLFGLSSGTRVLGYTWQVLPIGPHRYLGMAVHLECLAYYNITVR